MITFKKSRDLDNEFDQTDIVMETYSETLPDLLEDYKNFLMACGFPINFDDTIEINRNEDEAQ